MLGASSEQQFKCNDHTNTGGYPNLGIESRDDLRLRSAPSSEQHTRRATGIRSQHAAYVLQVLGADVWSTSNLLLTLR